MNQHSNESAGIAAGVELFNRGDFWHAHEAWEEIWLAATGERRRFLQGMIQLAAAFHHLQRGTLRGAGRLIAEAEQKTREFPEGYLGLVRKPVVARALDDAMAIGNGEDPWEDRRPIPSDLPGLAIVPP
ncbi:MAG: DUF309 domain-containing protein [Acidobacteriota bacterium]